MTPPAGNTPSLQDRVGSLIARWADGTPPRGAGETLAAGALRAASGAYRAGAALRAAAYDSGIAPAFDAGCPVISVGNLSAGGTGKTPMVIEVARLLRDAGKRVAIVSRGYRRQGDPRRTRIVSDGENVLLSPSEAGDEPWLMANHLPGVPVVVGADRVEAARVAVAECDAQAIVLDDGFQHRRLRRDCDIVLWDALRPASAAALLPRGLLREGLGALKRAHAVVFTRCDLATHSLKPIKRRIKRIAPHLLLFESGLRPVAFVDPDGTQEPYTPENTPHKRVVAVCGIGNPNSFWRMLEREGIETVDRIALPDHHRATPEEIDAIWQRNAPHRPDGVLMTEKDRADLPPEYRPPFPLRALAIRLDLGDDGDRFQRFMLDAATQDSL